MRRMGSTTDRRKEHQNFGRNSLVAGIMVWLRPASQHQRPEPTDRTDQEIADLRGTSGSCFHYNLAFTPLQISTTSSLKDVNC